MKYHDLIYSVTNKVVTITLNRPERLNSLSERLEIELHRAFDEADEDPGVRAIILTGAGKAFCTGHDQAPLANGRKAQDPHGRTHAEYLKYSYSRIERRLLDFSHMWRLKKPIIAAVNGWAFGIGFFYTLASDVTIASDQAVFGQPETRHTSSSSFLLASLCGWKVANSYALTGDHFDADEALRIGAINEIVPHDELMQRCQAMAERMALLPEPSTRLNKAVAMLGIQAAGLQAGMLLEGALGTLIYASHDEFWQDLFETLSRDGPKAYLDKRDGPFQPEPFGPRSAKAKAAKK